MSRIVPIRLTDDEVTALDKLVASNETVGFENRSEFFRLLLQRERVRRGEKVSSTSFRTVSRLHSSRKKHSRVQLVIHMPAPATVIQADKPLSQSSGTFVPCPVAQINLGAKK
jgi:hypothetical protein